MSNEWAALVAAMAFVAVLVVGLHVVRRAGSRLVQALAVVGVLCLSCLAASVTAGLSAADSATASFLAGQYCVPLAIAAFLLRGQLGFTDSNPSFLKQLGAALGLAIVLGLVGYVAFVSRGVDETPGAPRPDEPIVAEPSAGVRQARPSPRPAPAATQHAPGRGSLVIASEPPSIMLELDGDPVGPTAVNLRDLEPGAHSITARVNGYAPYEAEVTVEEGEAAVHTVRLRRE